MAEVSPNFMRTINLRTKDFSRLKSKQHKQHTTPIHEFKISENWGQTKTLKAVKRKKRHYIRGNKDNIYNKLLIRKYAS